MRASSKTVSQCVFAELGSRTNRVDLLGKQLQIVIHLIAVDNVAKDDRIYSLRRQFSGHIHK
jgi:hypothetical protein